MELHTRPNDKQQAMLDNIDSLRTRIMQGEDVPMDERNPMVVGQEAAVQLGRLARQVSSVKMRLTEV